MRGFNSKKSHGKEKQENKFFRELEYRLPAFAFTCLLCSLALLLYQIHLNQTAVDTLEALTATVPAIRWYEEETDVITISASAAETASIPSAVQSVSAPKNGKCFVLNTSSKKIHAPDCRYAVSMNSENKDKVENVSLEELLAQGYTICSVCHAE